MKRRIVITGMGVVSSLGIGIQRHWAEIKNGKTGIKNLELFDGLDIPVKIVASVNNEDFNPKEFIKDKRVLKLMSRSTQFAFAASQMAIEDSGLDMDKIEAEKIGIYLGAGLGLNQNYLAMKKKNTVLWEDTITHSNDSNGLDTKDSLSTLLKKTNPLNFLKAIPNLTTAHISISYNIQGPTNTFPSSFTAGTQAIGYASRVIERGETDIMLAGGTDSSITPLTLLAYYSLGLLTVSLNADGVVKPFDAERDGCVIGEGAGVIILEDLTHALNRNANIYGEINGFGSSSDPNCTLWKYSNNKGLIKSVEMALKDSGLIQEKIDYICANGMAMKTSDKNETYAIKKVFGDYAYNLPMSSLKPILGHLGSASGPVELITTLLAMKENIILPTINYTSRDPACDLDYVPNLSRKANIKTFLINSLGLEGQSANLIVSKFFN